MTLERTDLDALRAVCEEALRQHLVREAEQDDQNAVAVVDEAGRWAAAVLGEQATAALGPWTAIGAPRADTAQAYVEIAPRVRLLYTVGVDGDDQALQLVAFCRTCQHVREPRINSLLDLISALQRQGLR